MLGHPTLEKLAELKLTGMVNALEEQLTTPGPYVEMTFEERLGLLVDREDLERIKRRLFYRLRRAIDKRLMASLIGCRWITEHRNLLLTGPTGTGKTYIACALAHKACREGFTAYYARCSALFRELELARADGTYPKRLTALARVDVLILLGLLGLDHQATADGQTLGDVEVETAVILRSQVVDEAAIPLRLAVDFKAIENHGFVRSVIGVGFFVRHGVSPLLLIG